jgi:hypothetical protein
VTEPEIVVLTVSFEVLVGDQRGDSRTRTLCLEVPVEASESDDGLFSSELGRKSRRLARDADAAVEKVEAVLQELLANHIKREVALPGRDVTVHWAPTRFDGRTACGKLRRDPTLSSMTSNEPPPDSVTCPDCKGALRCDLARR